MCKTHVFIVASESLKGQRVAYLPSRLSYEYFQKNTVGVLVEQTEPFNEDNFEYLKIILRHSNEYAEKQNYNSVVYIVFPETYLRIINLFAGNPPPSMIISKRGTTWEAVIAPTVTLFTDGDCIPHKIGSKSYDPICTVGYLFRPLIKAQSFR
jgi:hypothetical protein